MTATLDRPENAPDPADRPGILKLTLPYWYSPERWLALTLLALCVAISFTSIYAHLELNRLQGELTDKLIALDWPAILPLLIATFAFGLIPVLMPLVSAAVQEYLELRWRTWMTSRYLQRWTQGRVYHQLERDDLLSNADQRISEDIRGFVNDTLNLFLNLVSVVSSTLSYTLLLWTVSGTLTFVAGSTQFSLPGYTVVAVYLYSFGHLWVTHWLGRQLIRLNMQQKGVEADFRFLGMQLRENAEQIAFYGGGSRESARLIDRFGRVRDNTVHIILRTAKMRFGHNFYSHVFTLLPTLLPLPLLLSGQISYGDMIRIVSAYGMLSSTLAFFPQAYQAFTNWLAQANRLRDLHSAIYKAEQETPGIQLQSSDETALQCHQLQLALPSGSPLLTLGNWRVEPGQHWLLRGRSGCGKSTLLRACAGLWPYGSGSIRLPAATCLFLPQKSYIPAGSLKDALCYPSASSSFTDEQCRQALLDCRLESLSDRLQDQETWQKVLSGGEQQRLAFARILLQQPVFIFLDEATSALDGETEQHLYQTLLAQLPDSAVISIAHRTELLALHDQVLDLVPTNNP